MLISLTTCRKWNPIDLANELKNFGSIVDPEGVLSDKGLYEKLNKNYFATNKVYEKLDVNIFVISDISEIYAQQHDKYIDDLIMESEKNPSIISEQKKSSLLTIIFISKKALLVFKRSEKLIKILSNEDIKSILNNVLPLMKNKNYSKAILITFEKLDIIWKKYKKSSSEKINNDKIIITDYEIIKRVNEAQEFTYRIGTIFTVILVIIGYFSKKRWDYNDSKNHGKIIDDDICTICLNLFDKKKKRKNYATLEEICIKNLNKNEYIAIIKCGHTFHANCISDWFSSCEEKNDFDLRCPNCRTSDLKKLDILPKKGLSNLDMEINSQNEIYVEQGDQQIDSDIFSMETLSEIGFRRNSSPINIID